jgi:hypothetical protein
VSRAQCVSVGWACRADGHERLGLPSSLSAHPAAALYGDGLATIDEHGVDRFALMGVSDPPLSGRRSCSLSVTADEARAAHSPAVRRYWMRSPDLVSTCAYLVVLIRSLRHCLALEWRYVDGLGQASVQRKVCTVQPRMMASTAASDPATRG